MTRKISLFNKSLVLIAVSIQLAVSFSSCAKNDPQESFTGKEISVAVEFQGYTPAGDNELKSQQSTILGIYTQPLDDETNLIATLEKDKSSATKAGTLTAFAAGTKIRVIAVKAGTNTYVSRGDFTIGTSSTDTDPAFKVKDDQYYDFYCISYNSTAEIPSDTVPPFKVELGNRDFLLAKLSNQRIYSGSNALTFTLKEALTKVSVMLDASADNIAVKSVGSNTNFYESYKYAAVNGDGTLSNYNTETNTTGYSWTLNAPTGTATSNARTVYVNAPANTNPASITDNNFYIFIDKISFADTTWTGISAYFNQALSQGVSYTVKLTLARTAFAGSNIYWVQSSGTTGYLTFDDKGITSNEQHQGLLFKWGSLTGISPSGEKNATFTSSTPIYSPNGSGGWMQTTTASWTNIPYATSNAPDKKAVNFLTSLTDGSGIGDICRYIATQGRAPNTTNYTWRLPTSKELLYVDAGAGNEWTNELKYGWRLVSTTSPWSAIAIPTTNTTGTYNISNGVKKFNAFFPAAGARFYDGSIAYPGAEGGNYWSGSGSGDSDYAYSFGFDSSVFGTENPLRTQAFPIRCVRIRK
jgi:hypothetical protein